MKLDDFSAVCHEFWDNYFKFIIGALYRGQLDSGGKVMLFPKILLCTQTKRHLVAELIGADKQYNGLIVKERKQDLIEEYLTQFEDESDGDSLFLLNASNNRISGLCLSHEIDFKIAESKFPALGLFETRVVQANGSNKCLIEFGPQFHDASFMTCILVNTNGAFLRAKYILEMLIVSKNISKDNLFKVLNKIANNDNTVKGVTTCNPESEREYIIASQLQSLYLTPHLHETTIGAFINEHPDVIKRTFNTNHFIYEPYLEWVERVDGNTDNAINPDLILLGPNGSYDILDFKTALLDKIKVTKGERNRRRFIDAVNEGVAQLANYEEYFTFDKNREYAYTKYGITVNSPHLYLVVGNYDNTKREEVEQALRPYKNITILDYDSMIQLYIAKSLSSVIS